ncbi:hydrolase [Agrilactobacillus composti DSM 18527 = JCM 14202]|nr:bis(5'-nucleosyl)-tetraphosphatase (symmetrical) YqeK [Agrilactobacillus composti]GAF39655.1 hydrolase [Agrilactobacillus composti DSM 18527 = JCM 14202]
MSESNLADLLPYSYAELLDRVSQKLKPKRFEHVQRVADTAEKLAQKYGADVTRARVAGIVHDYAKDLPDEAFKQVILSQQLDPALLGYNNGIWHGVVGTYFIQRDLQIYDPAILSAVGKHTIGAPKMSKLDQIIFIADFIEPGREFPGVDAARKAAETSLAAGVAFELAQTLNFLVSKKQKIYPKTIASYNAWVVHN